MSNIFSCIFIVYSYIVSILDYRDPMLRSVLNDIRDRGRSGVSSQAKGYIDVYLEGYVKKVDQQHSSAWYEVPFFFWCVNDDVFDFFENEYVFYVL
jgi:hypothetical protein